ncbi:MAG: hypothetical protein ACM3SS_25055 [Rhodospirillaceae bacterium]
MMRTSARALRFIHHRRTDRFADVRLAVIVACVFLAACSTTWPAADWKHRTDPNRACNAEEGFQKGCDDQTPEIWVRDRTEELFRIHFVEFDDQGWLLSDEDKKSGEEAPGDKPKALRPASKRIDWVMDDLTRMMRDENANITLVVYVHGWKHNAQTDDRDVRRFRQILAQLHEVDKLDAFPRKTVGVYIGWRGASWRPSWFATEAALNVTFWTRKAAATRVAQGQVRELFARLRGFQDYWHQGKRGECQAGATTVPGCRIRSIAVGHSFGGLILYTAVSQSLIDQLTFDKDVHRGLVTESVATPSEQARAEVSNVRLGRLADLVLLINPAFEAVRYMPLHTASAGLQPAYYELPIFVSVTSVADLATRLAFPLGRSVNTTFERFADDGQKQTARNTPGHVEGYWTHTLEVDKKVKCADWEEVYVFRDGLLERKEPDLKKFQERLRRNIVAEDNKANEFFKDTPGAAPISLQGKWPREFCGGLVLRQANVGVEGANDAANTRVWNIHTDENVILDHSNYLTPEFFNFIRQLYRDVTIDYVNKLRIEAVTGAKVKQ